VGAQLALVRFSGGGGRPGTLERVSLEAQGSAPRLVDASEELAGALAAPVWGRYGSFRGQPPIAATLRWSVAERSLMLAGTRGTERLQEILLPASATAAQTIRDTSRDTSSEVPTVVVERVLKSLSDAMAFEREIDDLSADQLADLLSRLEGYEGRFPGGVAPAIRVLYTLSGRLPPRHGMLGVEPSMRVTRVVLRMLRGRDEEAVSAIVADALGQLSLISD
jgi:hypothetical protein